MGVVSGAALDAGGAVTGVLPAAMIASGGEKEAVRGAAEARAARDALCDLEKRQNVRLLCCAPSRLLTSRRRRRLWVPAC